MINVQLKKLFVLKKNPWKFRIKKKWKDKKKREKKRGNLVDIQKNERRKYKFLTILLLL